MLSVTVFFGFIAGSFALTFLNGNCPEVGPLNPVDVNALAGDWWLLERNVDNWDNGGKCGKKHIDPPINGTTRVVTSRVSTTTSVTSLVEAKVTVSEDNVVHFRIQVPIWGEFDQDHWILDSDPENYVIIWNCQNWGRQHTEGLWIFGRNKSISGFDEGYVRRVLGNYGLRYPEMVRIDNENCL
ncbi:apolipoprotein D-like [Microplitis demolitor]|uniref:apolipoprotein D-like n=1 Tax=Microplitis demolitor TaxID=69319 RepID=UPI0004CDAD4F|nr:apolipoprotein D-like [Microplitis demolitor]